MAQIVSLGMFKRAQGIAHDEEDVLLEEILTRAEAAFFGLLAVAFTGGTTTSVATTGGGGFAISKSARYGGTGWVTSGSSTVTTAPPTTTQYTSLDQHPEYSTRLKFDAEQAIIDLAADYYRNKTPSLTTESSGGGGASQGWRDQGVPPRVAEVIARLRVELGYA
jgi:hypothetical protein